jgi:hypothetical protein
LGEFLNAQGPQLVAGSVQVTAQLRILLDEHRVLDGECRFAL